MKIYIDESIHEQFGFMLLAFVACSKNPQKKLLKLLNKYGVNEFHSLDKMKDNNQKQKLREEIVNFINDSTCKWGVFIFPSTFRFSLAIELTSFIRKITKRLSKSKKIEVFLDEGIIRPIELKKMVSELNIPIYLSKSNEVFGIQLADLVAAYNGIQLKEEISQSPKILTYGEEFGYDPPIQANLGWELWAKIRYSMCHKDKCKADKDSVDMATFKTKNHGLFISKGCSKSLISSSKKIFGEIYFGCIH